MKNAICAVIVITALAIAATILWPTPTRKQQMAACMTESYRVYSHLSNDEAANKEDVYAEGCMIAHGYDIKLDATGCPTLASLGTARITDECYVKIGGWF